MSAVALGGDGESSTYRQSHGVLPCSGTHGRSGGDIDESARRLSRAEYGGAQLYASEGHQVRALAESPGRNTSADYSVCGIDVEQKSFQLTAERGGGSPSPSRVRNKLVQASKQADHALLFGEGSGLTEQAAQRGLDQYTSNPPRDLPPLKGIRIKGDGFDLSVGRLPERRMEQPSRQPERTRELGL